MSFFESWKKVEYFLNNSICSGKYWKLKLISLALLLGSLSNFTSFQQRAIQDGNLLLIFQGHAPNQWHYVHEKKQSPFINHHFKDDHASNAELRLTVPVLANILHLNLRAIILVQYILGLVFLYFIINFAYKIVEDKILVLYFLIAFAGIYPGISMIIDVVGYHDTYAFFFMMAALQTQNPVLVFVLLQMGYWTDERALVNSSYIFLWYFGLNNYNIAKKDRFSFANQLTWIILLSWIVYFIVRTWLKHRLALDISMRGVSFDILLKNLENFEAKWYVSYESFWLFILLLFSLLLINKERVTFVLLFGAFLCTIVVSFLVDDVARSFGYSFILLLICLKVFKNRMTDAELKLILMAVAMLALVFPVRFPF